jgi:hypothetical protein
VVLGLDSKSLSEFLTAIYQSCPRSQCQRWGIART